MLSSRSSALPLCAFLLAVLACVSSAPLASAQPQVNYTSYSSLVARLRSTPYDPAFHASIAQTLQRCITMYAFADLAINSSIGAPPGAQFTQQNINVSARLEAFAAASFSSNFDVEDAAGSIFLGLNDAHTAFHRSYSSFGFARSFRLSTRVVPLPGGASQQSIFLAETPMYDALYRSVYGFSPLDNVTLVSTGASTSLTSVDGWEVVKIDGEDAVSHLWSIASDQTAFRVGLSKDTHTRFNLMVDGRSQYATGAPGAFTFRSMASYGIPPPDTEWTTLQLRDPSNPQMIYAVRYQWLGMAPQQGLMTFGAIGTPEKLKRNSVLRAQQMEEHLWSIFSLQHPALAQQRAAVLGLAAPVPVVSAPAAETAPWRWDAEGLRSGPQGIPGSVTFEVLADNTGVLKIYDFEPAADAPFILVIQQALTAHQQILGGTRLIIDLRGNGGGEICLGYAILRFIFPAISHPTFAFDAADFPFARYDTIVSPLTQLLADQGAQQFKSNPYDVSQCQGFFTPCMWLNPETQLPFVDESWFDSGRLINRGGETSQYTALFHDNCASAFAAWAPADINVGYTPDNTVILSDGVCGSTCSVFSSFIQYKSLAKSVAMGGVQASPSLPGSQISQQFWSFPGGQVINLDDLLFIVFGYGVNSTNPLVPAPIPGAAKFTWALREIYPWNDADGSYPLEFTHAPADFHFGYATNFSDSEGIYQALIADQQIFSPATSCVPGVTPLACPVADGQGEFSCINGVIGQICVASICNAGFYAEPTTGTCQPCAIGTYRAASTDPALQSSCVQCTLPASVVTPPPTRDANVTCVGAFTAEGWTAEPCPYSIRCNATSTDRPDGGRDHDRDDWIRPSKFWTTVALLSLLSGFLFIIAAVQCAQRVAHKRRNRGLDDDMTFARMQ